VVIIANLNVSASFTLREESFNYIEYLKGSCEEVGELCDICRVWSGPKTDYVPRPYPNYAETGFHYLPGRQTPVRDEEGNIRAIDDFQPRAALKKLHQLQTITSSNEEEIEKFSAKYIVPKDLVQNYLQHLEHLELLKQKRQKEEKAKKEVRQNKKYEEYDWQDLYQNRKISSLKVSELDKYLAHNNLSTRAEKMKKKDKISLVEAHIAMTYFPDILDKERELEEEEANEEEDIVICEWGTPQSDEEVEVFCLCRQPENELFMVCCDRCDEWFHGDCINMSEEETEKYLNDPKLDFICPFCIA
jgi:hypothetical protein